MFGNIAVTKVTKLCVRENTYIKKTRNIEKQNFSVLMATKMAAHTSNAVEWIVPHPGERGMEERLPQQDAGLRSPSWETLDTQKHSLIKEGVQELSQYELSTHSMVQNLESAVQPQTAQQQELFFISDVRDRE